MSDFNWDEHPIVMAQKEGGSFNWDEHPVVEEPSMGAKAKQYFESAIVDQLPALGSAAGGIGGGVIGAGAGGATGKALQNVYNRNFRPELGPKSIDEAIGGPLEEGVKGAGMEAFGLGAGAALSPVARAISARLAGTAEKAAVNATGATGKEAASFASDAGRQLLERKIVRFGDSQKGIAARAGEALERSGEDIGASLEALGQQGVSVDQNKILNVLRQKLASIQDNPGEKALANQLRSRIHDIEETIPGSATDVASDIATEAAPSSSVPIGDAEKIKRAFDRNAKWDVATPAASRDADRAAANAYRSASEEAALSANPDLAAKFKADKDSFALLSPITKAAERRAAVTSQHAPGGFLDTTAALAGGSAGGIHGAVAAPLLRRAVAPRISSSVAVGTDALSRAVAKSPEAFGNYGPILMRAASAGPDQLALVNAMLQKMDAGYRSLIQKIAPGGQQ